MGERALAVVLAAGLLGACATRGALHVPEPPVTEAELERACVREVEELHAFFQAWFTGELPADEAGFARFERALAPEFVISPPDGGSMDRDQILAAVRAGHGGGPVRIWVEAPVVHVLTEDQLAVCYEEWHERDGVTRGRSSRAIFRPRTDAPEGVEWVRVDEIWLD